MKQSNVSLQPLDSERSRLKPPPRPAPPRPLVLTANAAERTPSRRVIRRTVSEGDSQNNSCPPNIRIQLNTSSCIASAPPKQTSFLLHVQQREIKGGTKNRLLRTQSTLFLSPPSATPRQRPRPLSTSMTNLKVGKEPEGTLTMRDTYRLNPELMRYSHMHPRNQYVKIVPPESTSSAGMVRTKTNTLRGSTLPHATSRREPHQLPRLPPVRPPKPNFGTPQNAKQSSPKTKSKPARPPPPLQHKARPPIPLPDMCREHMHQSEGLVSHSDSKQPDDSDLTYSYVYVQRRLQCQSNFNSRAHSASDDCLNTFAQEIPEIPDSHIYSELLDTTREEDYDCYTLPDTSKIYTPLSSTTMKQASIYDVPSYSKSQ